MIFKIIIIKINKFINKSVKFGKFPKYKAKIHNHMGGFASCTPKIM